MYLNPDQSPGVSVLRNWDWAGTRTVLDLGCLSDLSQCTEVPSGTHPMSSVGSLSSIHLFFYVSSLFEVVAIQKGAGLIAL